MNDFVVKIIISPSRTKTILIYSIIVLVLLSLIASYFEYYLGHEFVHGFVPMFKLDEENNIPTYYSTLLLLTASCLLYMIYVALNKRHDVYVKHWFYLSIIFLSLSIDEASSIHELLISPLRNEFNFSGIFYFSWVVVGFIVVVAITIMYLRFLLELPRNTKISFVLAACVYVGGALGVELLGGAYASNYGVSNLVYALITTVEEMMEMAGVVIFINALIKFIYIEKICLQLNIVDGP